MCNLKIETKEFPIVDEIEIIDSKEPLVEITEFKCEPMYYKQGYKSALDKCYCRVSVLEHLKEAKKYLPEGYDFLVYDAYRPIEVQQSLFDKYRNEIKEKNPELSEEELDKEANFFVAKPSFNRYKPSVHNTGGAIDLTLVKDGKIVDMGTEFDDFTDKAHSDYFEVNDIDDTIRDNRRILYTAMTKAGFTSLPTEWWHFDYGDLYWAYYLNKKSTYVGLLNDSIN